MLRVITTPTAVTSFPPKGLREEQQRASLHQRVSSYEPGREAYELGRAAPHLGASSHGGDRRPSYQQHHRNSSNGSTGAPMIDGTFAEAYSGRSFAPITNDYYYKAQQPQNHVQQQPVKRRQSESPAQDQGRLDDQEVPEAKSDSQIAPYLQIPSSISKNKDSLSEFAAQITCLLWFESSTTLQHIEDGNFGPGSAVPPLSEEAHPTMGFRKWVTTILSTTQVTQNVILLALLFIYRLKKQNPSVRGKAGSEYRLLTVALMLGNKFLDDNTYTNKTWADVSGITVSEIHIMEVEFLSNMRYNLYTSTAKWNAWHRQLRKLYDYLQLAHRAGESRTSSASASPNGIKILPSPPMSHHSSHSASSVEISPVHPMAVAPYLPPTSSGAMPRMPEIDRSGGSRKRSHDESFEEPMAKRLSIVGGVPPRPASIGAMGNSALPYPGSTTSQPISLGSRPSTMSSSISASPAYPTSYAAQLPPPKRAMAMVYGEVRPQDALSATPQPQNGGRLHIPPMFEQQHQQQPARQPASLHPGSASSSPTAFNYSAGTPDLLSPQGYTIQRSSPYRPVRGVNTLLVPPPSASLHSQPLNVGSFHMHYQPLGRPPSERRSGVVPYLSLEQSQSPWPPGYSPWTGSQLRH